jgi:hypothetical protein
MISLFSRSRRAVHLDDKQQANSATGIKKTISEARKDGSL